MQVLPFFLQLTYAANFTTCSFSFLFLAYIIFLFMTTNSSTPRIRLSGPAWVCFCRLDEI